MWDYQLSLLLVTFCILETFPGLVWKNKHAVWGQALSLHGFLFASYFWRNHRRHLPSSRPSHHSHIWVRSRREVSFISPRSQCFFKTDPLLQTLGADISRRKPQAEVSRKKRGQGTKYHLYEHRSSAEPLLQIWRLHLLYNPLSLFEMDTKPTEIHLLKLE